MNIIHVSSTDEPQGQATFGMANLRKERTGLPFIVFMSQKGGAQHDLRVKVSPLPKVRLDQLSSYALRPYRLVEGPGLSPSEDALLRRWVDLNISTLADYWNGVIEYTEDALDQIKAI